jgi:large conductance mechanosensitive channel
VDIKSLAVTVESGNEAAEPIMISYGLFLQNIIDFLVIALCVFCAVSVMNKFNKKKDESKPAPAPSPEQELLAEIRDILKASK